MFPHLNISIFFFFLSLSESTSSLRPEFHYFSLFSGLTSKIQVCICIAFNTLNFVFWNIFCKILLNSCCTTVSLFSFLCPGLFLLSVCHLMYTYKYSKLLTCFMNVSSIDINEVYMIPANVVTRL